MQLRLIEKAQRFVIVSLSLSALGAGEPKSDDNALVNRLRKLCSCKQADYVDSISI